MKPTSYHRPLLLTSQMLHESAISVGWQMSARVRAETPADDLIKRHQEEIARRRAELARTARERDRLRRQNERLRQQLDAARHAVCGGNRTGLAAHTHQILMTVFRTSRHRALDPLRIVGDLLREREPRLAAAPFPT